MQLLTQGLSKPQSAIQSFMSFRFFTQHLNIILEIYQPDNKVLFEPPDSQQERRIDVDRMDGHSYHIQQGSQHDRDNLN